MNNIINPNSILNIENNACSSVDNERGTDANIIIFIIDILLILDLNIFLQVKLKTPHNNNNETIKILKKQKNTFI